MINEESFRHTLPRDLVHHVTAICGGPGVAWLDDLPDTIADLEARWSITVGQPFPAGEFNFVAASTRADGELTVLKIAPPFPTNEIRGEAEYLKSRDGRGAVRLLAEDVERRSLLLERALPGENLAEKFGGREPDAVLPAIEVLHSILGPAPAATGAVKKLDNWFDGLRRAKETDFAPDYVEKALEIYERLSPQPGRIFYLHGDFHPGNIVTASRSPYLAIDPKGIVGHIGYEIAVFLNNFHWWQETYPDIRDRLAVALTQFSDAFDICETDLREWAFAQMVLGAWWSVEEMPQFYDNAVAKADIWNV